MFLAGFEVGPIGRIRPTVVVFRLYTLIMIIHWHIHY